MSISRAEGLIDCNHRSRWLCRLNGEGLFCLSLCNIPPTFWLCKGEDTRSGAGPSHTDHTEFQSTLFNTIRYKKSRHTV